MRSDPAKYLAVFVFLAAVFFSAFVSAQPQRSEELVLTTYYPVPYGDYQRLRLVPATQDASFVCDANSEGTMYYDAQRGQVLNCRRTSNGYSWQAIGLWSSAQNSQGVNYIYPDSDAYSVVIGGTQLTGNYKLQVYGTASINDVWLSNPQAGRDRSARWASDDSIQLVCQNSDCSCPSGSTAVSITTSDTSYNQGPYPWWWGWPYGGSSTTSSTTTLCVRNGALGGISGGSTSCGGGGWGGGW